MERDTCLTWFPGFLYQLLRSSLSIRPDLQLVISRWNLMARSSDGIYPRRPSKVVLGHQARSSGVSAEGIRGIPRRIRLLEEWLRMEWNGYLEDLYYPEDTALMTHRPALTGGGRAEPGHMACTCHCHRFHIEPWVGVQCPGNRQRRVSIGNLTREPLLSGGYGIDDP